MCVPTVDWSGSTDRILKKKERKKRDKMMMKRRGRRCKKGHKKLENQRKRSKVIGAKPWGRIKPNVNSDGFSNVF